MNISLIVTDSSPLITLAIADALDTLLLLGIKVIIPDLVKFEVVRHIETPGAIEILDWLDSHQNKEVWIGKTEEYDEFKLILKNKPDARSRNRGERAAAEILFNELKQCPDAAILLFEDSDIQKANFLIRLPDNVITLSTSSFLDGLEKRQLIPSANDILLRAVSCRGDGILERTVSATGEADMLAPSWESHLSPG